MSKLHFQLIRRAIGGTAVVFGLATMSACTSVPATQSLALSYSPTPPQAMQTSFDDTRGRPIQGTAQADYMPIGDTIAAPVAFLEMCERSPVDCQHGAVYNPTRTVAMARDAMVERVRLALGGAPQPLEDQNRQTAAVASVDSPAPGADDGVHYLSWSSRDIDTQVVPLSYVGPTINHPVQSYGIDAGTLPDLLTPTTRQPADDFLDASIDSATPDSDPTPGAIADDNRPLLSWGAKANADEASLVPVSATTYQAPSIQYDTPQTYDWSHLRLSPPAAARPVSRPLTQASNDQTSAQLTGDRGGSQDYSRFDLNDQAMNVLRMVNDKVNRMMRGATDEEVYHVADYWNAPELRDGVRGDCEDYALEKRRLLVQQGVPAAAMSIAIVRTRLGEDHAVLVVSTYQGDYILDNLQYDVRPWRKANYSWISRQGPNDDLGWVSLAPANGGSSWHNQMVRVAYSR